MMMASDNPMGFSLPQPSEFALVFGILGLILIILMPLPEWLIDVVICINIALGILLLMMSLFVKNPVEMATFPSIILVGTMIRLALGIATTRAILAHGEAGEMILAFGEFVTGGDLLVGMIIFIIIIIVNFMVITKGSERVAEVGARFALDAMPGKQMVIDGDFNAGLISPDEAQRRREELQRESALYGAMDGAMKFVKGDAIAGILITLINLIGGLAIGIAIKQMPFEEAINKYSILTVGDGLTQQVSALMMSVSAGITMTRSTAQTDSLGKDLLQTLQLKPFSLIFSGIFMLLIAASSPFTGMPWYVFLPLAIGLIVLGVSVFLNKDMTEQMAQLEGVKEEMNQMVDPNRMYQKLGVDPVSVQVGMNLLQIADPEQNGQLLGKIAGLRNRLTDELGFILPNVRILDSMSIGAFEYLISIRGNPVGSGNVYPGRYMILAPIYQSTGQEPPADVVQDIDPSFNAPAFWLEPEQIPPEIQAHAVEATDVVITHLQEISIKYVDEVMTKMDVLKLMELVRQHDASLVQELVPQMLTPNDLRKIFVNLIRERVSIKDVQFIFERLSDYARFSKEPDVLSERIRSALGRQICVMQADQNKNITAVTLSNDWERTLDDSCQRTELGTMFLLNPAQVQQLVELTAQTLQAVQQQYDRVPVILCSPRIRLPLYQLLDRHLPMISVLSYSELIPDIQVNAVGSIE
ncbi:MAG: flagellar biosynthesis protein FlhA [Vampirovibrionales bacterium]